MLIYFAGTETGQHSDIVSGENALATYFSVKNVPDFVPDTMKKCKFKNYFLDSGAYGAWTRGMTLDVHAYGKYVKRIEKHLTVYASLDDKDSEANTVKNLDILEKQYGLNPLPVWHAAGKNYKLLAEYLEKYDYIAVGAIAGEGGDGRILTNILRKIFSMALAYGKNPDGTLKKRYHGFGFTPVDGLLSYPWYSADSTTWLSGGRFGTLILFDDKTKKLKTVHNADKKNLHKYWTQIPKHCQNLFNLVDSKSKGVKNYETRLKISADAYKRFEEYITKVWEARGIKF